MQYLKFVRKWQLYFPVSNRVMTASVAPWAMKWPDCYEEAYKMAEIFNKF